MGSQVCCNGTDLSCSPEYFCSRVEKEARASFYIWYRQGEWVQGSCSARFTTNGRARKWIHLERGRVDCLDQQGKDQRPSSAMRQCHHVHRCFEGHHNDPNVSPSNLYVETIIPKGWYLEVGPLTGRGSGQWSPHDGVSAFTGRGQRASQVRTKQEDDLL